MFMIAHYRKQKKLGRVIKVGGVNFWAHEDHSASALAKAGYIVKFVPAHNSFTTADAYVDNTLFEFKSPEGSTVRSIQRNIVRAINHQSANIVIDSCRMKNIQDRSIQNFLIARLREGKGIKRLFFVTRDGRLIDINKLV